MKKIFVFLLLCLQLLFVASPNLEAATTIPPKPTTNIYVQDYAKVLSPQTIANINAYSTAIDRKTTAQITVVTIPTLDGASLEDYSLELFRQWGIGNKEKNNGVLLLVVVNDRQSRIEVGYGLEGVLPDGLTGRIQGSSMLPLFKQGNYDQGIWNGYGNIATSVLKEYNLTPKDLNVQNVQNVQNVRATTPTQSSNALDELPWWTKALLIIGFVILMIVDQMFFGGMIFRTLLILFMRGGGRGGGGGFGGGGFGGGSGGGGGSSRRW